MRKTCKLINHKALVSRLLFILTRCSRLVLSGWMLSTQLPIACKQTALYLLAYILRHTNNHTDVQYDDQTWLSLFAEEPSPISGSTAMYGTQPRNRMHQKQRRFSGFPFTSQRPYGGVHKKLGSPRSPIARATTLPTRFEAYQIS